jgi:ABC-type Na+ efflux pump permease subunit
VAWREFRHTALTKGFILGTIVLPAVIAALFPLLGGLLKSTPTPITGTVAVVDDSGRFAPALEQALQAEVRDVAGDTKDPFSEPVTVQAKVEAIADVSRADALRTDLSAERLTALVLVHADGEQPAELLVPSSSRPRHTQRLERGVRDAVVRIRAQDARQDYDQLLTLLDAPRIRASRLSRDGAEARESVALRMLVPVGFMMLLWIAVFGSANYLLTGTIEEKSSRVMEVLLSAVSPMELLAGKLLGQAAVSAVVLVMYGGVAMAGLGAMAMMDVVPLTHLLWVVAWFPIGYLMVAAVMAGIGSAVNDLHEAQSLVAPAMIALVLPLILWLPISENPNGALAVAFSFIPPASPFVNVLRLTTASDPVPLWQVLLALVVAIGSVVAMMWAGARVFRVGVLMQGKTPTPRELLRWLRAR